jgi:putative endonuclease
MVSLVLMKNSYTLYILQCSDGTLYTGITTDMERRLHEHNDSPIGAKYTRARRPVTLVYSAVFADRSLATTEESRIKKLSRAEKLEMIRKAH